jgi:hypothetical protein
MAEPIDMIVPMLREMRSEMISGFRDVRGEMAAGLGAVNARLDKLEATLEGFRYALPADSLLSKLVTGEFEQRIEFHERKVRELESLK